MPGDISALYDHRQLLEAREQVHLLEAQLQQLQQQQEQQEQQQREEGSITAVRGQHLRWRAEELHGRLARFAEGGGFGAVDGSGGAPGPLRELAGEATELVGELLVQVRVGEMCGGVGDEGTAGGL